MTKKEISRRCTETRADGSPCSAWAVRGSDPPRCAPHGGGRKPARPPQGNQNARTHGFYARTDAPTQPCSIRAVIDDLYTKQCRLSQYMADPELSFEEWTPLMRLHGATASRLGRLLRVQHLLNGDGRDVLDEAFEQALKELGEEWDVDLIGDDASHGR